MNKLFLAIALVSMLIVHGCSPSTGTNTPVTPNTATIAMQQLSDLPKAGGDVSSVSFLDAQTVVAVIDGKIATVPVSGGQVTILHSNATFESVCVGGSKEIYALAYSELWVLDNINSTPKKSSVFTRNGQTLSVNLSVGTNGQPYLRVLSYPSSMQVWTSTDKGVTWTTVQFPTLKEGGGGFAFGTGSEVYASSPQSFYSSNDNGTTWTKHPAVKANYGGELLVRKNGDVVYYIPNGGGLWSSSDKGNSFTNLTPFNDNPFYSMIREADDGYLYALLKPSSSPVVEKAARLMRSLDGKTWTHVLFAEGRDLAIQGSKIAVAMSGQTSGGIAVSDDMGQSFKCAGTQDVQAIQSFGWNASGDLCVFADKGLFVKTSSGWRCHGNALIFGGFCSAGGGIMYLCGINTCYVSNDAGKTWKDIVMPPTPGTSGTGTFKIPVVFGVNQGDALVSVTYFRYDLSKHTNGRLLRLKPDGSVTTIKSGTNYIWMAQAGSGRLYARTDNFATNQYSADMGFNWTETPTAAPGFVFNNTDRFIASGGGMSFRWGTLQNSTTATLTLDGYTSQSIYLNSALFDAQDRLHILSLDKGLFVSSQSWR